MLEIEFAYQETFHKTLVLRVSRPSAQWLYPWLYPSICKCGGVHVGDNLTVARA